MRLVKSGNSVHLYRVNFDGSEDLLQSEVIQFTEGSVLAGLAVGGELGTGEFENVQITELPVNVIRTLPTTDFSPGMSMSGVEVKAVAREGASATATVNEVVPRGSQISNVQVSAGEVTTSGNTISWTVGEFSGEATLTYDITLPNRPSVSFPGTFNGTGLPEEDNFIEGVSVLPVGLPEFGRRTDPIQVDANFPTLFQVETGTPGSVQDDGTVGDIDADALGFALDPRVESGIAVINTNANEQDLIIFEIEIPEDGTYYLFGNVRGEDGNSDSWHFNIDEFPSGGNDSRWNIPGSKVMVKDWVEQEDPDNDPRSFELSAGTHTVFLAGREDSSSIDWLAVTNNPDLDISQFDELAPAIFSRSADSEFVVETDPVQITVEAAAPSDGTVDAVVNEVPPAGWEVSDISATTGNASLNGGQITWDLSGGFSGGQQLTYTVVPPADVLGGAFRGTATANGINFNVGGRSVLSRQLSFETQFTAGDSIDMAPVMQLQDGSLFVEAEDLPLFADANDPGFEILFDPTVSQQQFVNNIAQNTDAVVPQHLVLQFEITEPGDYAMIANTRTPTGSDDSWWLGVDEAPQPDTGNFRWQGSGDPIDDFVQAWVAVDNVGPGTQQTWNFDAGVHFFQIHPREDGSQVDWFYLTNDLSANPADFESPNAPPETRVENFMLY